MASVWVEGVDQLNRLAADLGDAGRDALPLARLAVQKTAADIKTDAQTFAPVDTGNLKSSISYETRELAGSVLGEVGPTAAYGAYVEYGTSTQAPQAYMGPAFDRRAPMLEEALAQIADRFRP